MLFRSEVIERNVLRIGRKVAVVVVFAATIHVLLAPYYYVRGLIEWNNPVSDFWVFTYTFQNLSSFVWLSVSPVLLLIGLYEVFRCTFLIAKMIGKLFLTLANALYKGV